MAAPLLIALYLLGIGLFGAAALRRDGASIQWRLRLVAGGMAVWIVVALLRAVGFS